MSTYHIWASEIGALFWATNQTQNRSIASATVVIFLGDDGGSTVYGIEGIVTAGGSPVTSCVVRLYDRTTGNQVDDTTTNGSGFYSFTGLAADSEKYFVIAFDPSGGTSYNLGCLDRLTAGH